MSTPQEELNLCYTVYPNVQNRTFNISETGKPLLLTPMIKNGQYQEAAKAARVTSIFQTVVRFLFMWQGKLPLGNNFEIGGG